MVKRGFIPPEREDEYVGVDGQRIPPGFHLVPRRDMSLTNARTFSAIVADDDASDVEEAFDRARDLSALDAQSRIEEIDLRLATLREDHAKMSERLAKSLARLAYSLPPYIAPPNAPDDLEDVPWNGVNDEWLANYDAIANYDRTTVRVTLEKLGYFGLLRVRTYLQNAVTSERSSLTNDEIDSLYPAFSEASRADARSMEALRSQLRALANPTIVAIDAQPKRKRTLDDLRKGSIGQALMNNGVSMEQNVTTQPSCTLMSILRDVRRLVHVFENEYFRLVQTHWAKNDAHLWSAWLPPTPVIRR